MNKRISVFFSVLVFALMVFIIPSAISEESTSTSCDHNWSVKRVRGTTCTKDGKKIRTCTKCGKQETIRSQAPGHKWGNSITTQEPTCIQEGSKIQTCSRCGEKQTISIPKTSHNCVDWKIVTPATDCTTGMRAATCTVCGENVTEEFYPEGTLRKGDKGDEVKELQSMLACRGFLNKNASYDGDFGSGTENAVIRAQEANGLTPDGIAWPQTTKLLEHDYGPWTIHSEKSDFSIGNKDRTCATCGYKQVIEEMPTPMYKQGTIMNSDEVKLLQQALNDAGYNAGVVDGKYGEQTELAIKKLQRDHGLTEDGIAWPGVLKLLPGFDVASEEAVLMLNIHRVSQVNDEGILTFEWLLSNDGAVACDCWQIECHSSSGGSDVMAMGSLLIKPNGEGSRKGRFEIALDSSTTQYFVFEAQGTDANGSKCESSEVSIQLN